MRRLLLACLILLTGCGGPQVPETYEWSFAPQDNLLARLVSRPTRHDDFFLDLNFAVIALQARARQQPELAHCDRTPLPGCEYLVRMVEKQGPRANCRQVSFMIADKPPGERRVSEQGRGKIDCPADIR